MQIYYYLCTQIGISMKNRLFLIALLSIVCMCACAETIVLRTGAHVKGTVVLQNDDVVIVRDAEGARFQYPRADVLEILADEQPAAEETPAEEEEQLPEIKTSKKMTALLELGGGAAVKPNEAVGAGVAGTLLIGTHHIGRRHIFIGGGLGYNGLFLKDDKLHFLPIQVAVRVPFIEAKNAPVFGAALGYAVALSKEYKGGIYAGVDVGYRFAINPRTALALMAFVQFQQAKVNSTITIEGVDFSNKIGYNLVTPGVKLAFYF